MQQLKQILMTLALLMTAATGAWATAPTVYNTPNVALDNLQEGDILTDGFTLTIGSKSLLMKGYKSGETIQTTEYDGGISGTLSYQGVTITFTTGKGSFSRTPYVVDHEGNAWIVRQTDQSYVYIEGYDYPAVSPTGNLNQWSMVMPAGNVRVDVAYKDRTTMALTYDGTAITPEANAVTAFKGFEQEFAEALTPAVQNIEPTFNSGSAVDVTTTLADDFTFKSSDAAIIGFKSGQTYADEGTLDQMEFRELTAENTPVTLTVTYKGTNDLESKSQTLLVTVEKKTYSVSLADNTEDATNWKGNVNDAQTDVDLPITLLDGGEKVVLKYNGQRRVRKVTATTDAKPAEPDPLETPLTMEVIADGTIQVNIPSTTTNCEGMKYSLDGGQTKTTIISTTTIDNLKAGDKVQFYGIGTSNKTYGDSPEVSISGGTATVKVYGNVMSLFDEDGFATNSTLPDAEFELYGLFKNNTTLTDASGLLLPATELKYGCYQEMFNGCSNLEAGPVLPAPTLYVNCYSSMFYVCSKLASVTCLATSGINTNGSTENWLNGAGTNATGTKTVTADPTATWPRDVHGIPSGWTRLNPDGTEAGPTLADAFVDSNETVIAIGSNFLTVSATYNSGAFGAVTKSGNSASYVTSATMTKSENNIVITASGMFSGTITIDTANNTYTVSGDLFNGMNITAFSIGGNSIDPLPTKQ